MDMTKMAADIEAKGFSLADSHRKCFACGAENPEGLRLKFCVGEDGVARTEWKPEARCAGYPGRVHGGIIATLLDCSIVHALAARGVAGLTVELSIRYSRGVRLDLPVEILGWVDSSRHGVYLCHSEARQDGRVEARATAKFMTSPEAGQAPQASFSAPE